MTDWAMKNEGAIRSLGRLQADIWREARHMEEWSYTYRTNIMEEPEAWEADKPPDEEAETDPQDDGCAREETMDREW